MGYPETAEGFMIHDFKKWSTFKKEEVRQAKAQTLHPAILTVRSLN